MKRRNIAVIILVTVLAVAAVPFLDAQPRMGGHGDGRSRDGIGPLARLDRAKAELGLSDQQVEEIKAVFASLREQNAPYREQVRGGLQTIISGLVQDPSNVAAAQARLDQQAQAERAMRMNALNAASRALSVLTPDQRTKLAAKLAEFKGRRSRD